LGIHSLPASLAFAQGLHKRRRFQLLWRGIPLNTAPLFTSRFRFMSKIIEKINNEQLKTDRNVFGVGDTVCVHTIVKEGDKERVQKFTGIVIGRRGTTINASFTVRRISYGEGVE